MGTWRARANILGRLVWAAAAVSFLTALLAGVPWLLTHLAGWPLPDHVPTSAEVTTFLGRPMGQDVIGNILACLAWLVWAAFTAETLLASARALTQVRAGTYAGGAASVQMPGSLFGENRSATGNRPSARLAAALISAVILAVMSVRPTAITLTPQRLASVSATLVVTPSALKPSSESTHGATSPLAGHGYAQPEEDPGVRRVVVRAPHGREHDSLWRIAERELGSPRRWQEVYRLNVGRLQPDGQRLHDPDRIYPGWILRLPEDATRPSDSGPSITQPETSPPPPPTAEDAPTAAATAPPSPASPPSQHALPPLTIPTRTPAPAQPTTSPTAPAQAGPTPSGSATGSGPGTSPEMPRPAITTPPAGTSPAAALSPASHPGSHRQPDPVHGIELPSGGYVGLGLAAALSAVLAMARARRRRRALQNGSLTFRLPLDPPPEQPPPAVVQLLHRAHLTALAATTSDEPDPDDSSENTDDHAWVAADAGEAELAGSAGSAWSEVVAARAVVPDVPDHGPIAIGVRDGQPLLLDLPGGAGLGLIGTGADGVARALVAAALTRVRRPRSAPSVSIVLPYQDALRLFGPEVAADPPPLFTVVTDLEHALDRLEVDMLARRRQYLPHPDEPAATHSDSEAFAAPSALGTRDAGTPILLLVATPDDPARIRLDAILTLGRDVNVTALLLGPWPTGRAYDVDGSGHVAAEPSTRLFTLTQNDTHDIIDVVREAFSPSPPGRPVPSPQRGVPEPDEPHDPSGGGGGSNRSATRTPLRLLESSPAETPPPSALPEQATAERPSSTALSTAHRSPTAPASAPGDSGAPAAAAPGEAAPLEAAPLEAARQLADSPVPATGVLRDWRDTSPAGPWAAPVNVRVLGQLRLLAGGDEVRHGLRGKTQELLLFVLLNPAGVSSETVADALWPASVQAASSLRSAMKRLRAQLRNVTGMGETMFVVFASGRYRPDRRVLTCDAWQFEAATRAATDAPTSTNLLPSANAGSSALAAAPGPERRPTQETDSDVQRLTALRTAVALYEGTLLDGVDYPWLEPYRQALRHHALHVFVRYATAVGDGDPESALAALERALPIDPINETLYRRVMRLQARLGRPEAIAGTLALLRRQLADIDERPERQTLTLAATLSSRDQDEDA